ncbi:5888_t:CDS:1, partial [Dentiscutata heterogama]
SNKNDIKREVFRICKIIMNIGDYNLELTELTKLHKKIFFVLELDNINTQ